MGSTCCRAGSVRPMAGPTGIPDVDVEVVGILPAPPPNANKGKTANESSKEKPPKEKTPKKKSRGPSPAADEPPRPKGSLFNSPKEKKPKKFRCLPLCARENIRDLPFSTINDTEQKGEKPGKKPRPKNTVSPDVPPQKANPLQLSTPPPTKGKVNIRKIPVTEEAIDLHKHKELFPAHVLPAGVLARVVGFLRGKKTLLNVLLTCKNWWKAFSSPDVWAHFVDDKSRALLAGKSLQDPFAVMKFGIRSPFANLLNGATPTTLAELEKSWRLVACNSSSITITSVPFPDHPKPVWAIQKKIRRKQIVNLEASAVVVELLDKCNPDIVVSAVLKAEGKKSLHRMKVSLMGTWKSSSEPQEVIDEYDSQGKVVFGDGEEMVTVNHVFPSVKSGVRYITYEEWSAYVSIGSVSITLQFKN